MTLTYSNPRMSATFTDWPYGSTRTTATFTVETHAKRGQRAVRVTINPATGKPSAPKALTYARLVRIVDGSDGRTYIAEITVYGFVSIKRSDMKFDQESVHESDPRMADLLAMFA